MKFETYFKLISYTVVICGFLSLFVSGGVGFVFAVGFLLLLGAAWFCEDSRWQLSDRLGTALVMFAVPLFYLVWRFNLLGAGATDSALAALLSRFILGLSLIKLFQRKRDRDWLFLYLMAFFEVLLSAALSISPIYLGVLVLYLLVQAVAIIALEIGKSARLVQLETAGKDQIVSRLDQTPFRRLPSTAILLIAAVIVFAAPIFFMLPRVGGAGLGADQNGITGMTAFSDRVRLGEIGRIQQSDQTVMRVKVDSAEKFGAGFRWRGIALDEFDNKTWKQSRSRKLSYVRNERELFVVGTRYTKPKLVFQTFYLEPMDTSVLFALPRAILVQGGFAELRKDEDDGLATVHAGMERTNYSVQSDIGVPSPEQLRSDQTEYPADEMRKYLQLPDDLDPRIAALASEVSKGTSNRYDRAKSAEEFLQTRFGYTLEQKASGPQPVADFLFNIREGHCEYFSSSMVLMLRTQGIAARVVNGFQQGQYNDTADVFIVKQKDAHSWVEVYFPKDKAWIAFDPTPFAGQGGEYESGGIFGSLSKYLEALETFWIEYFVAYDNNGQKSLFRSVKDGFSDFQDSVSTRAEDFELRLKEWWAEVRGEKGLGASLTALGYGALYLAAGATLVFGFMLVRRQFKSRNLFGRFLTWLFRKQTPGVVEFYERMRRILERRGLARQAWQTPLEFANSSGIPEALLITEKYNRVRFGGEDLSETEAIEVGQLLSSLERPDAPQ
jgi:transglutaminase-like putative cysteine protease